MNKKEQAVVDGFKSKLCNLESDLAECNIELNLMLEKERSQREVIYKQKQTITGLEITSSEKQGALNFVNSIIYNDYPENFSGIPKPIDPTGTQKLLLNIRSILTGDFIL